MSGFFFIIFATFLWALDTLIRYPLVGSGVSVRSLVFVEQLVLTIIFIPVLIKFPFKKLKTKSLISFLIIGAMGSALGTLAFTQAFRYLNPSIVILLQKLQPLVAIILARLVLSEKLSKSFFIFVGICLLGGFLISYEDISLFLNSRASLDFNSDTFFGYALTLFAVVSWGASTVFGKNLENEGFSHFQIMAGRFFFGFLALIVFTFDPSFSLPRESGVYFDIMTLIILSGLSGMYFYYRGLKILPAKLTTLSEMFFSFFAVILNWYFLDKVLGPIQIVGGVLLVLGAMGAQVYRQKGEA